MTEFGLPSSPEGFPIYQPDGEVLRQFLRDRSHVSIIRGPLGSGTSSACAMRIYMHAMEQRLNPETGKRHSRWIILRDSYPNLRNTTIRTWLDWFPEEKFGRFFWDRPYRHEIRIGDIELDVVFFSALEEGDVQKFRSMEYTGAWFNELEYMSHLIFMEAESRTGRYPSVTRGGSTWDGIIADMNAPDETHWLPKITGEVPIEEEDEDEIIKAGLPHDWAYFVQPPALLELRGQTGRNVVGYRINPDAENVRWLKGGAAFYEQKAQGKTKAWIDSRLRNQITFVVDGSPVFKNFNSDTHIAAETLEVVPGHDVIVGLDFGRARPAAICMQVIDGRIFIQHEFRRYGVSATGFAPEFKRFLEKTYAGCRYRIFGDPKGQDRGQADERTSYDVFKYNGLLVSPAPVKNNAMATRIMAVESVLGGPLDGLVRGLPRFNLSPTGCQTLKAAMSGRYRIKKNALGEPEPIKDKYSDICDALQYAFLGMGEGRAMVGLDAIVNVRPIKTSGYGGTRWNLGGRKVG